MRVYDDVLTAGEITWLDSDGASGDDPGTANLQGHWKLDNDYLDETENNNDGSLVGALIQPAVNVM